MFQKSIDFKKLRTGRETVYFVFLTVTSLLIWSFLFFSMYRQFTTPTSPNTSKDGCFVRDKFNNKVYKIDKKYLLPSESCISWNNLYENEKEQLLQAENGVVEKTIASLTTPVFVLFFLLFGLFSQYLAIAYIRMNAVKVGPNQLPEIWQIAEELSRELNLTKQPDVFIMLGEGVLNAFATKLIHRKIIVVYSELVVALLEKNSTKELKAVLGHEMGHHALSHTKLRVEWLLLPVSFVPFLMALLSRQREFSADRVMTVISNNTENSKRALIKLIAGKDLGNQTDIALYLKQAKEEKGFFAFLSERLATHPHIPNRINAVESFAKEYFKKQ